MVDKLDVLPEKNTQTNHVSRHSKAMSDFTIIKTLGTGAFGVVYLARDKRSE